jgi:predicted nucleic acid-binding protein
MTVLVDTSAWVEYLRGTGSRHHAYVRRAIARDDPLGWTDPVLYELTAGAASAARAGELRALLLRGPFLAVAGLRDWERAADLYRTARSRGLTVRSAVDCLVAAVALRTTTPVVARDRDFAVLAEISDLDLLDP